MRLIEDEDFVAVTRRSKDGALTKLTSIVNTVVTRSIDFNHVKRTTAVTRKLNARRTFATRGIGRTLGTVETASQNTGGCGLAAAARATEKVCVINSVGS